MDLHLLGNMTAHLTKIMYLREYMNAYQYVHVLTHAHTHKFRYSHIPHHIHLQVPTGQGTFTMKLIKESH